MKALYHIFTCIALLVLSVPLQALEITGQLSGWGTGSHEEDTWHREAGLRYIPQATVETSTGDESFLDLEASLHTILATSDTDNTSDIDPHRLKLRFATAQTETILGLQKLNFGPARILRSLKWFDRIDPRDPLRFTEGVYALRFKYSAISNANFWLWGLYGNEDTKGYERLATADGKPEFGGRLQFPVPRGEIAATVHFRQAGSEALGDETFREERFGLDGRWDIGIGLWFEAVMQRQAADQLPYPWQRMIMLGADYTLGLGNGLYLLGEHMVAAVAEDGLGWDEDTHLSALFLSYPLSLLDNLTATAAYSWEQDGGSLHVSWQRAYDDLTFSLNLFHAPQAVDQQANLGQADLMGGNGAQLLMIFYH